jgi:hypothetical protein
MDKRGVLFYVGTEYHLGQCSQPGVRELSRVVLSIVWCCIAASFKLSHFFLLPHWSKNMTEKTNPSLFILVSPCSI